MKKLIPLLLVLLSLNGCIWMWDPMFKQFYESEVYKHNQSRDWICMADLNHDSQCKMIPCETVNTVCRGKNFRVSKAYYNKTITIYSLDPLTDLAECERSANAPPKIEP